MKLQWVKTGKFVKWLFPDFLWDLPDAGNAVALTFDDGPVPDVTPWVLDLLARHDIKATFFCIGDNIRKHPEIFRRILEEGHSVGNHTFHHLNGWKTDFSTYVEDTKACDAEIEKHLAHGTRLFRPPYGKISGKQKKSVLSQGKDIVMWDILTVDYDPDITPERCLRNATEKAQPGSILIFHDSVKAWKNLEYALPRTIEVLKEKRFGFRKLD